MEEEEEEEEEDFRWHIYMKTLTVRDALM